jgi:hypothetical protein
MSVSSASYTLTVPEPGVTEVTSSNVDKACIKAGIRDTDDITRVIIRDGVTTICKYAFLGYGGLTSVVIPDSVTTIGKEAFEYCTGLMSVVIPNVTTIGDSAFYDCIDLESITIGANVSIGKGAFDGTHYFLRTYVANGNAAGVYTRSDGDYYWKKQ